MVVDIAGAPVRFTTTSAALRELLSDRFRHFLRAEDQAGLAAELAIDVVDEPPCARQPELRIESADGVWHMTRGDFEARWDQHTGLGRITQTLNPYSTDSVLRIVQSLVLSERRGFLLHASSLVRNGRAFVFTGPSGVGKTTMTRLAPPDAVLLTDEISCLRQSDGEWRAYGTPFAGELGISGRQVSAPVAAVYRLEHAAATSVRTLSAPEGVRALMRNLLFFTSDAAAGHRMLDTVCDLGSAVPVKRLAFTPDSTAWAALA